MIWKTANYYGCADEQQFKMHWIRLHKPLCENGHFFCIETEETVKGFPDVMQVVTEDGENKAFFFEFKYATKNGKIKFQPTQPAFFKRYEDFNIKVIAYNPKSNCLHEFEAKEIFKTDGIYRINERAEINLTEAEERWKAE